MGLLFVLAWAALWAWDASPYGRYLHHGQWSLFAGSGQIHHMQGEPNILVTTLFYVFGWVLMSAAMMLPTTLPLLESYRRLTQRHTHQWVLIALVICGYLGAWMLFGIVAHGLDHTLHGLLQGNSWVMSNTWAVGAALLCIAGLFQFSSMKYRCLDNCRSPLGFSIRHWNTPDKRRHALLLGLDHGIYCVGCCWALMLLMFVLGSGSIGWMLLLGAVMAAEKNLPIGNHLSTPLGVVLIACAGVIVLSHM